jgi:hypothetical protein
VKTGEIGHVHFQDVPDMPRELLDNTTGIIPGDGISPLPSILHKLADKDMQGPLSVETVPARSISRRIRTALAKEIRQGRGRHAQSPRAVMTARARCALLITSRGSVPARPRRNQPLPTPVTASVARPAARADADGNGGVPPRFDSGGSASDGRPGTSTGSSR